MRKSKFEPGESANVQCTSHGGEIAFNTVRVNSLGPVDAFLRP